MAFANIAGAVTGGMFDLLAGREANKANLANDAANRAAQAENQQKAILASTGDTDFGSSVLDPATGRIDTSAPGGPSAADARSTLAKGDATIRAPEQNRLLENFKLNIPNIQSAKGLIQDDINTNRAFATNIANKTIADKRRDFGGLNNSRENAATLDALDRIFQGFQFGDQAAAFDLFNKQGLADLAQLQGTQQAFGLQAPAPAYDEEPRLSWSVAICCWFRCH
jgi:hypothetical protein